MAVRADQIVVGSANYPGAKIVGMEEGQFRFRSADGGLHKVWLDEVRLIIVDRRGIFDDFNQAERFLAGGEPERAIVRYRRALRLSEDYWVDLIAARLLLACDAVGQQDNAVLNFIRVANGGFAGPPAAARLFPTAVPEERTKRTQRAVEQLHNALSKDPAGSRRALFELLRYDVLSRTGDKRASQAIARIAAMPIPPDVRTPGAYAIQLRALRASLADGVEPSESTALDRAMYDCPRSVLPDFLLLKGETLLQTATTRTDIIRATWPFLRAAIHFHDEPQAAEAFYGAALALERIGRSDKAVELLDECLAHKQVTERIRQVAEAARARLQSALAPPEG